MKQLKCKRSALRCLYWAGSLQLLSDALMQIYPQRWDEVTLGCNTSLMESESRGTRRDGPRPNVMWQSTTQPDTTRHDKITKQPLTGHYTMRHGSSQSKYMATRHTAWWYGPMICRRRGRGTRTSFQSVFITKTWFITITIIIIVRTKHQLYELSQSSHSPHLTN